MPRTKNAVPAYLKHARSGLARVGYNGRDYDLAEYGSRSSKANDARRLKWIGVTDTPPAHYQDLDPDDIAHADRNDRNSRKAQFSEGAVHFFPSKKYLIR